MTEIVNVVCESGEEVAAFGLEREQEKAAGAVVLIVTGLGSSQTRIVMTREEARQLGTELVLLACRRLDDGCTLPGFGTPEGIDWTAVQAEHALRSMGVDETSADPVDDVVVGRPGAGGVLRP